MKSMSSKVTLRGVVTLMALPVEVVVTLTTVSTGSAATSRTTISTRTDAFGTMLEVGSGKYAGYTVYLITSD